MSDHLPADTLSDEFGLRCPWCHEWADEATVSLEALLTAWNHDQLGFAPRCEGDVADPCSLVSECPACKRPFMVALQDNYLGRVVRLLAVRTAADAKLLGLQPCPEHAGEWTERNRAQDEARKHIEESQ